MALESIIKNPYVIDNIASFIGGFLGGLYVLTGEKQDDIFKLNGEKFKIKHEIDKKDIVDYHKINASILCGAAPAFIDTAARNLPMYNLPILCITGVPMAYLGFKTSYKLRHYFVNRNKQKVK